MTSSFSSHKTLLHPSPEHSGLPTGLSLSSFLMSTQAMDTAWRGYHCPARENISFLLRQNPFYIPTLNTLAYRWDSAFPASWCPHRYWTQHGEATIVQHVKIYRSSSHKNRVTSLFWTLWLTSKLQPFQHLDVNTSTGHGMDRLSVSSISWYIILRQKTFHIPPLNTLAYQWDSAF